MPVREEFGAMNSMPLFDWMRGQPLALTWWLAGTILLLSALTANTLLCSLESVLKKREGKNWLLIISPQVIHVGFLFILLAHLVSSFSGMKGFALVPEGTAVILPDEIVMRMNAVRTSISPEGYITDMEAEVEFIEGGMRIKSDSIRPNRPSFYKGIGVYLKNAGREGALIEVSEEPGAVWALIGGVLFMLGTVTLIMLRMRQER
jgi:cytochrome c biogenesis protein ResB